VLDAAVDTISSIYLTLTNTGATAELNWTPVADPPLASSNGNGQGFYQVYQEYPAGTWTQIAGTTDLSYSVPVIWCNEQVNFRVDLSDNLTCISQSNVVGDILNNPNEPDPQQIDSVTVENELARISWSPNPQTNVTEYTVEQNNNGIWTPLTTVLGYNNTDWVNPASNASTVSELYRLKASNDCLISGEPGLFHRTILAAVTGDGCERSTTVTWSPYINWPEGVREYEIHASLNGATETKVGTVADTIFEFIHENLMGEATYCYRIVAVRDVPNRITSTSNDTCVELYIPKRPDYSYNYNTTVQPGNTGIEEYFFTDSTAGYIGFEIQRGLSEDATNFVWFLPYDPNTRYYDYVDAGARPRFNSYYYRIIGVDSCEQFADTLNVSRTILLEAEANANRTNSLQWNAYEGWRGGVAAYNIYRSVDGPFEYLKTVPPNQLTATDSIQEIIIGEGNFCYYIEAVEGIGAPVGPMVSPPDPVQFMELSRSNEACARQHPNVFMPNAFMPEGVNNIFKPVTVYVQADSYLFQIYNRWGQRIFETTDPNQGWNGSHNGKEDPQGAYVYFVSFVSSNGETYSKSGSVTLIR
jgi:gliding motility-associated-like protein